MDYIGVNSIFSNTNYQPSTIPEIRLRIAVKAKTQADAAIIGEEVEALYTNGPTGGGGVRKYVNEIIGSASVLVDRNSIKTQITYFKS